MSPKPPTALPSPPPAQLRLLVDRGLGLGALGVLLLGLAVVGPHHAPWFDEAQSWLLARDSNPLEIAVRWARYEGSPALWQSVLWLFQRLGGGYAHLWWVSAVFALAGAAVIVARAPFPLWLRIGLIFTYYFAYQYSIVARSYALDLFLVPVLATLFHGRAARPLAYGLALGLTANTNAFGFVLAGVLAAEFAASGVTSRITIPSGRLAGLGIAGSGLLIALLQVWPAPAIECRCGWSPSLLRASIQLGAAFVQQLWPGEAHLRVAVLGGIAATVMILAPMLLLFRRSEHGRLIAALLASCLLLVGLLQTQFHHAGMILVTTLFCLWVSWPAVETLPNDVRAWLSGSLAVLIGYQTVDTGGAWLQEMGDRPYSAAREAAAWLRVYSVRSDGDQISAIGSGAFALQPYFGHNIIAEAGGPGAPAFYRWSPDEGVRIDPDLATWRRIVASGRSQWLAAPDLAEPGQRALVVAAARSGYVRAARFPAQTIWKTRRITMNPLLTDDGLQVFTRRTNGVSAPQDRSSSLRH